jgi:hypothetical protein
LKEEPWNRKPLIRASTNRAKSRTSSGNGFFLIPRRTSTHNALIHPDAAVVYPEMCFVDPDMSGGKAFLERTLQKDEANFIDLKQTITSL